MTADMPDAVKVAREACAMRAEEENFPDYAERVRAGEEDTWSEVSGAILGAQAMQAAMAGRELRVKALEWVDRHANPIRPNDLVANSIVGRYAIRPSADGARFRLFIPGHDYNDAPEFNSIEAAKGAGKVHFDQTILSALSPAGPQEDAMGSEGAAVYPEYEADAIFRCSNGCGKFRRDRCNSFRGSLCCPRCRMRWTLTYVPATRAALEEKG